MTRPEALAAMAAGMEQAAHARADSITALGIGEMGIGNTSTSAAVLSALTGADIEAVTGRGGGLTNEGFARKKDVLRRALTRRAVDKDDVLDVLCAVGGLDIAGLCGMFLGGAIHGIPIVMDGFISGVAALCAARLCPNAGKAAFASHASSEPAARLVLEALGKQPLITADMHLGEGTGAVASIPLWDMALAVYQNCYSFAEGGIEPYTPQC